jgi:transketolase
MIKSPDGEYRLNYAVSATQKAILKAFGMTSDNIKKQAKELGTDLKQ